MLAMSTDPERAWPKRETPHCRHCDGASTLIPCDCAPRPEQCSVHTSVGLGNGSFPEPWTTVRIDPLTGVVTTLSELLSDVSFVQGQNVHDPDLDHMFLQTGGSDLLVIHANTGELLVTTPIVLGIHTGFLNPALVP